MASLITLSLVLLSCVSGIVVADAYWFDGIGRAVYLALLIAFLGAFSCLILGKKRHLSGVTLLLFVGGAFAYTLAFLPERHLVLPTGTQQLAGRVVDVHALEEGVSRVVMALDGHRRVRVQLRAQMVALPPVGKSIRFESTLYAPTDFRNAGVPRYSRQLAREGILATGRLVSWKPLGWQLHVGGPPTGIAAWAGQVRARYESLLARVPQAEVRGFLDALTFGRTDRMPPEMRTRWQEMGIYHLVVVSGLHLGMFYAIFYGFGWGLSRVIAPLWQRFARQDMAILWGVLGVSLPLLLYPSTPSLYRAYWAVLAWSGCRLLRIPITAGRLLCVIALGFLFHSPTVLFDLSFQLSFLCLFSIVAIGAPVTAVLEKRIPWARYRVVRYGLAALVSSAAVFIGVLPITAFLQGRIHFIGILFNVVLIPLLSALVTPLWLGLGWIGFYSDQALLGFAAVLAAIFRATDSVFTRSDVSMLNPFYTPLWAMAYWLMVLTSIAVLASHRRRWPWLVLLWGMGAGLSATWPWFSASENLRITFLDVGQGDAYLLRMPDGRHYLVDGGGVARGSFDIGRRVVVPALRAQGVSRLEAVILSHPHADHFLGLTAVIKTFPVGAFWWSGEMRHDAAFTAVMADINKRHIALKPLSSSPSAIALAPEVTLEVLYPHLPPGLAFQGGNTASLVTRLGYRGFSFLMTGDIEALAELTLVHGPQAARLSSTLLKVPHHGSRSSSTAGFLERVSPQLAVISLGRHNTFGHPHAEVLARYQERNIPLLRTDDVGAIALETDGRTMSITTESGLHDRRTITR